jgi:dye decolorizing peroxidase
MTDQLPRDDHGVSRRSVLGYGAALVGGTGLGVAGRSVLGGGDSLAGVTPTAAAGTYEIVEPFYGTHQGGVATAPQAHVTFLGLDLAPGADRESLRRLLTVWTDDAARLASGRPTLADPQPDLAGPSARLTITVGVSRAVVELAGAVAPDWLAPLPTLGVDRLDPAYGQTDVVVQLCADDPTVVSHATRAMLVAATGIAERRWVQPGFRRPAGSVTEMRNLMGQVDGTVNPIPGSADFDDLVWVGSEGPDWLVGGSGLVIRRIAMNLDTWDKLDRSAKEQTIGRTLDDGTPLSGGLPSDKADLEAVDEVGLTKVPAFAHVRHAAPQSPRERFYRRPYSYEAPLGARSSATADAGLLFVTYQRNVAEQFVPVHRRLDGPDLLNQWTSPVGSAVYAVLPGCREGQILGAAMLGQG